MTIWTDLLSAIEAEAIAKGYTGTLAEVGIDQPYAAELITLLELRSKLVSGGGGSSTQRTPSLTSVTNSGTIALGARSVSIANIGAAAGTVLGTSVSAGVTVNFTAQGSDTLAAIAYNATGTTFLIAEVR